MKNQNKIYIIAAIFALISLILIVFLVWPSIRSIKEGAQNILAQKGEEEFINAQNRELNNFKNNYLSYGSDLEKADKMFVNSRDPVDFIQFLENTAFESGVKADISLAQNTGEQKSKKSAFMSFNIASTGDFVKILLFCKKLEYGPYLVEIQNIEVKNTGNVSAIFSINVQTK